ncbi:PAS domain S-box-containing protein/diguanylate cyclase (GGDEF) domain-containing protein [Noviherbaspirillum humi]|uniref:PAS domain S-box-containing protein/diguanylate cyclase (GGDEF) domain-containing protein n=1 Tax=Noviherbaspirillum humi TaxID=1688639 RepID=A0A239LHN5_9BURK|nr:EAL domain-containing protein [Noviherbaspirillum humi]SNT29981.1 PAS domain S-box-containing protein/diguanylate cyclase (GGDEF) domain-containing protein [Noviherbaspirillum humi]
MEPRTASGVVKRLVELLPRMHKLMAAAVVITDQETHFCAASTGLDGCHPDALMAFCRSATRRDGVMVVSDTSTLPELAEHAMVKGAPWIRFYAAVPLKSEEGKSIGILCVMDRVARMPSAGMLASVAAMGEQIALQLLMERRQTAMAAGSHDSAGTSHFARVNRALRLLSACNESVMRATSEAALLNDICGLAVNVGGYLMAWVGYAQPDEESSIKPMAHAGQLPMEDYLSRLKLSWSPTHPGGNGPGGRTIREGRPVICDDIATEDSLAPWRPLARHANARSLVSLPLRDGSHTFGVFGLYSMEAVSEHQEEIELLQKLADNLAYGISSLRSRLRHQRIEAAVLVAAAGVSASGGSAFFEQLAGSMALAVGAQAGIIGRFLPGRPLRVRSLGAVADGAALEEFDYNIEGTPCERLLSAPQCVVSERAMEQFPDALRLHAFAAQAYVGLRLDDSAGQAIGLIYVLFREAVTELSFVTSTLRIFAARAAGEMERLEADARIRNQASLLDQAQDAIIVSGIDHHITYWNKGAERLYGWSAEEALGKDKAQLLYRHPIDFYEASAHALHHGEWRGEVEQRRKDGESLTVEGYWTLVRGNDQRPQSILAIHTNVTQRKAAEREIERLAFYDPLTRLPNRRLLVERLQHALENQERDLHGGALLFLDLDDFKTINDTLGHDKGDLLLQQVAQRLISCVRKNNTVARLGGDEFVIMLEQLSHDLHEAASQARVVAGHVLDAFAQPFHIAGHHYHTSPSIGIAMFGNRDFSVDELLKRADLAMYQAKAAGRNTMRFFDPEMQQAVSARVAMENDFRDGLQLQQFSLYYQAQADREGRMTGGEALVRWQHPRRGRLSPGEFIPLAEHTGLILPLGEWVLKTACEQLARWARQKATAGLSISVNVSARQFRHANFVPQVLGALNDSGANPSRLKIELTESLLVEDMQETIAKMAALKAYGVGFSLDDFGTGYSSLSYLKQLPLDQLKIDQSFVSDVLTDPNDAAIASTIVALGQSLGLNVIAEGVETEAQRDFLADHGCHAYQGYLYGRPMPAEQFEAMLRAASVHAKPQLH